MDGWRGASETDKRPNAARHGAFVAVVPFVAVALLAVLSVSALEPDRAISQYAHRTWKIEDGLPHSVVRAVQQAEDGYLWIATYEGLARFNGESFTRFNKSNVSGLRRDTILAFLKARDGSIWLGTNGGGAGKLAGARLDRYELVPGLPSDITPALAEGPDGEMWIGTTVGFGVFRNGAYEEPVALPDGEALPVLSIAVAPDGTVWIGSRSRGLRSLRGRELREEGFDGGSIYVLLTDPDGTLWVGAGDGLFRIANGERSRVETIPVDQIPTLLCDRHGNLWVGTYSNGLYRIAADGAIDQFTAREGLLNNSVRSLFEDAEGTLWVGTNSGLESLASGKFVTIGPTEGLSESYTRSAFEDSKGNVWIGTAVGLNRISSEGTRVFTTKDGLSSDYVFSIGETPDGAIWAGTSRGLNRYQDGRFRHYGPNEGITSPTVRAIHCDRSGTLWIGTDAGAYRLEGDRFVAMLPSRRWSRTYVQAFAEAPDGTLYMGADGAGVALVKDGEVTVWNEENGLPDGHILSLLLDRSGTLWIGTDSAGLIRARDGSFAQVTTESGLPSDKVLQMLEDDEGRLWAGGGRGIWHASIANLDAFAAGKSTTVATTSFGVGDGMRSVQCNGSVSPSAVRTRDGRLWFPTVDGVATVRPLPSFPLNRRLPPVKIEEILVDGNARPASGAIVIPPDARQLEVRYAALTYVNPKRAAFRFRLEGFDPQWVDAGTRRAAYYTGVPPGSYRFQVIAANADGLWNEEGASLDVRIEPRFVQTVWFPILIVAAVGALIALFHLRRIHSMKVRETELMELVEQRTKEIRQALDEAQSAREVAERQGRLLAEALVDAEAASRAKSTFLANVSHELRTPLNAIIGFAHVLQQTAAPSLSEKHQRFMENIALSGEHLLRLINEILDLAKIEAGKITLDQQTVEIGPLLESVARTAKGLVVQRGVELEVAVDPGLTTVIADPTKLKQIVYNLVSNAAKFSPRQSVVRIEAKQLAADASPLGRAALSIAVTDHGVGIDSAHHETIFEEFRQLASGGEKPPGTGLGLALVRKFVELHQGKVSVTSAPGEGSTFTVVIPLVQVEA